MASLVIIRLQFVGGGQSAARGVAVRVVGSGGVPVEDFTWTLSERLPSGRWVRRAGDVRSSGDNRFWIEVHGGAFTLMVSADGYAPYLRDGEEFDSLVGVLDAEGYFVELERLPAISGRVLAGQRAVEGAIVELVLPEPMLFDAEVEGGVVYSGRYYPSTGISAISDGRGAFTVSMVRSGQPYRVRAWAPGYSEALSPQVGGEGGQVVLELVSGGGVRGRVKGAGGSAPSEMVHVEAFRASPWELRRSQIGGRSFSTCVDYRGFFEFQSLAPGYWLLGISDSPLGADARYGDLGVPYVVQVPEAGFASVELRPTAEPSCSLKLDFPGGLDGLEGALCSLRTTQGPSLVLSSEVLKGGAGATLVAMEPGEYLVVLRLKGSASVDRSLYVQLEEGHNVLAWPLADD